MNRFIFCLCLVLASNCFGQDNSSKQDDGTIRGEGWVIELESGSVVYDGKNTSENLQIKNTNNQAQQRKASGIEFIVGGEGKDGIAKKSTLPVDTD